MRTQMLTIISMRRTVKPLAILLCSVMVASCKKAVNEVPVAPTPINALAKFEVTRDVNDAFKFTFTNQSALYKKLEWRFGDDTLTSVTHPVHIYAKPGKYTVDLKVFSETGNVSRRFYDIAIIPDSVVKVSAEKTGVANQIRFGVTAKAPIASVLWTFGDVSPAVTSTLANPVREYVPGSFNLVTAQVTTTSGSVVSVSANNFTTEGAVKDITQARSKYTVSADNSLNLAESSPNVLDNNVETKYTMGGKDGRLFNYPLLITLFYDTPKTVRLYAISNSNDLPARDPKSWRLEGSNDGLNWEVLDTRTMTKNFYDQMTALGATKDADRFKKLFYYGVSNPKPFLQYRWAITANWGDAALQTNDFRLFN